MLPTSRKVSPENKFHEVNVLHALGEQNAGLAPAKVEKFLTSLGINYSMYRSTQSTLHKHVGKEIVAMAKESCESAVIEEAIATKDSGAATGGVVQLHVSGDAAWPNRGSGRSYASFCGMFVLVGALRKSILSASIFDKMCFTCEHAEKQKRQAPKHDCWRGARGIFCEDNPDWRGSSKAMEAEGAVMCVKGIGAYTFCEPCDFSKARVSKFTSDEDSNMISAINDPNGDVPAELRDPPVEKNSDPNHLQKLFYKALENLRVEKKWTGNILSVNVIKYFNKLYRYVVKSTVGLDIPGFEADEEKVEWISGALMNIVDHAFNIDPTHAACRRYRCPLPDGSFHPWCGVESQKPDWKIHLPGGKFLDRTATPGYYEGVRDVMARFAKKEVIYKQLHTSDTNTNESINGMVVKGYLPGGKAQQNGQSGVYGWACCHTIVSKNEGHIYRQELCRRLGIDPPPSMSPLDSAMDEKREAAAVARRTHAGKARRLQSRLEKPSRNEAVGKVQATYSTGTDLDNDRYGNKVD
ncbi:hypothetical protein CYMTET_19838 [Cymbomonas tetramitiformis]|uniref:Mutator-like transposase domain-containing protein n=1 Tax=Cymbomonas tetramitiformis TaxID=36881 RepID=A0AAE0G576_9CHLO|nr:hypothetical protein CYMTET_19838 [Cymbomonas tetramitiformis]